MGCGASKISSNNPKHQQQLDTNHPNLTVSEIQDDSSFEILKPSSPKPKTPHHQEGLNTSQPKRINVSSPPPIILPIEILSKHEHKFATADSLDVLVGDIEIIPKKETNKNRDSAIVIPSQNPPILVGPQPHQHWQEEEEDEENLEKSLNTRKNISRQVPNMYPLSNSGKKQKRRRSGTFMIASEKKEIGSEVDELGEMDICEDENVQATLSRYSIASCVSGKRSILVKNTSSDKLQHSFSSNNKVTFVVSSRKAAVWK